ncbi:YutD family protein [Lactobacillus selangorensis]
MTAKEQKPKKDSPAVEAAIDELTKAEASKPQRVVMKTTKTMTIDGAAYDLVCNFKDGFDLDKLNDRYNEILNKYDYIVGDWGYDQLRLRGFYRDDNKKANRDQLIRTLEDYLYEYCNFGCAYFVLERQEKHVPEKKKPHRRNRRKKPYTERKVKPQRVQKGSGQEAVKSNKRQNGKGKHQFTIRPRQKQKQTES